MDIGTATVLNMIPGGVMPIVSVNQYDTGYQKKFRLFNGAIPFNIASNQSVTIRGTKVDGHGIVNSVQSTVGSNVVTVTITEQMTAVKGAKNIYELRVADNNGLVIGTANFIMFVECAALDDNTIISDSDLSYANDVYNNLQSVQAYKNQLDNVEAQLQGNPYQMAYIKGDRSGVAWQDSYLTPEMFGAYGDGTHDDTSAIVAMFAQDASLYVFQKRYKITTINMPQKQINIDGCGTIVVASGGNGFVFNAPLLQKTIKNIGFILNSGAVYAMRFLGDSNTEPYNTLLIDNVKITASKNSGLIGIDLRSENEAILSNIALYGCGINVINSINPVITNAVIRHSDMGIYNANESTNPERFSYACGLRISNTTILGCTIGIKSVQCDSIQIDACMIDYNDHPIVILGTGEPVINNCYLSSRKGNTVIYMAPNNSGSGVYGGNGIKTEDTSDARIALCYVIQHDEALSNSAIVIKGGTAHVIYGTSVAYGGKSCIEIHDASYSKISDCALRSELMASGAKAITSYKNGVLGDDNSNEYRGISTFMPIYVHYARTDIDTRSYITKRSGTIIVDANTTVKEIDTLIPQGVSYAIVFANNMNLSYTLNGSKINVTIPAHTTNVRINWIAYGNSTFSNWS